MGVKQYKLSYLAEYVSGKLRGDENCIVNSIGTLQSAKAGQISFIANSRYQKYLSTTGASAVLLSADDLPHYSGNAIICHNPYVAYAKLSTLFSNDSAFESGVHPSANIHPDAKVASSAVVASGVVIGANTVIGDNVVVGPNVVVGAHCVIGESTRIHANATFYSGVTIGRHCIIHSNAVIGADGFGFANHQGEWIKIAQLGGVVIGDYVEIGAGTTIDRGAIEDTVIGNGVILDNQIQVAHNVEIGEKTAIAGCTAIAGSTKIGDHCTIAGACGITGHLEIAPRTHVTAMTLVTKSITQPGAYSSGTGMLPNKAWKKSVVRFRQLDEIAKRLKSLEEKISDI